MGGNGSGTPTMDHLWSDADSRGSNTHAWLGGAIYHVYRSLLLAGNSRCVAPAAAVFGDEETCASPTRRGYSCLRSSSHCSFYHRSLSMHSWVGRILAAGYGICWRWGPAPNGSERRSPTPSLRFGK